MKSSATTMGICFENEHSNETNSKLAALSLKGKIVDALSSIVSQLVISIVVTLFTQIIKFKPFECLSGFCYHNKSKSH